MVHPGARTTHADLGRLGPEAPPVVERAPARDEATLLRWVLLAHGALALVTGVLLLVWPDRTLLLVGVVLGVYLIAFGVLEVIRAFADPDRLVMERVVPVTLGLLAGAAGTVAIARPDSSVLAVALAVGIYLIVAGLGAGVTAIREPDNRAPRAMSALVNLAAGILIVVWPDVTVTVVAVVIGIALAVRGGAEILLSFALARTRR
jgi:uncharacterized membrane protein HdeD (DUF308 family)